MNMPEYMRVRAYLYNLIAKSDGKAMQIPSENELCRLFDVSRITIRGAIRGLAKDKYLIARRGIGTFMNPDKVCRGVRNMPTVGVLLGDGRCVINPLELAIADGIFQSGMKFEIIFLPDSDSSARLVETVKAGLDAVIWFHARHVAENGKYLDALSAAGIPLLAVDRDSPLCDKEIDSVVSTPAQRGTLMADYLFTRGHRNLLFVHNSPLVKPKEVFGKESPHYAYCLRMRELTGDGEAETGVVSLLELEERLRKDPDFIHGFSVLYSVVGLVPCVIDALDHAGIAVPAQLSYLVYGKADPYFFHGRRPDYVDDETAVRRAIFEWLELRLRRNDRAGRFTRQVIMDIVPGETVGRR
ncbi:MAG: GntR family transcriptional regulator [Lentisphaeria bacterium]